MTVNMIQDFGNKLEAKIDTLQETLNKKIDLKIKLAEMQNTITEIKNSIEGNKTRKQEAEEWISEVETLMWNRIKKGNENKWRQSKKTPGQL